MRKLLTAACAAAIAATSFTVAPASAESRISFQAGPAEFLQVQNSNQGPRNRGFHRRGDNYYFNGHRGYRQPRQGYRSFNGFYFPPEAFAGAIIGGIFGGILREGLRNNDRNWQGGDQAWQRHVSWCYDRYRSYRDSDNTFQPYNGPRRQCYSPFSG